jgi:hypothetical protein
VVGIKHNNQKTTRIRGGSRRRTSSTTQEQMEVVTWPARTAQDRRMSRAIVVACTSRLLWRRSNLAPLATPSLLTRWGVPLARPPRECRRLGALGTPPLACIGAWVAHPLDQKLPPPCHRPGNRRHYSRSRNRRHHAPGSGSHDHIIHRPRVHSRARFRATTAARA